MNGRVHSTARRLRCGVLLLAAAALAAGCVALATDYRQVGFDEMRKGFETFDRDPEMHEVIILKDVKIHIVGDRRKFAHPRANRPGVLTQGYATPDNEIYILGATRNGRIVINQGVLGHEVNHLLFWHNPRVHDPDKLEDIGA